MQKNNYLRRLVLIGLFSAISIVLTRFASVMLAGGTIRLGFGNIPIIFTGILLGPVAGGITGVISDLIGVLIAPQGKFHPGLTISAALIGIIPGLVAHLTGKRDSLFTVCTANILVYIIVALGLNTYWISQLVGKAFLILLPARAISGGIVTVFSIVIIYILLKRTKGIIE